MTNVRFLVIGVGGMGRSHLSQLLKVSDAQVVGLVDSSQASVDAAKSRFETLADVKTYADFRVALKVADADAAVIVTPHSQHFKQGMACLDAGLHVLMEKPFVSGSENARAIIQRAQEVNRHLAVAYQRHTDGPYGYLRQLIQSGELGEIRFISAYQAQHWLNATRGSWRQDPELSCGGQLNDSGSHLLDVVLWSTGLTPLEVYATIDNRGTGVDIDSAVTVRFEGGAIGTWSVVGSASIRWHEDVSFHGERGTALYRNGKLWVAKGQDAGLVEVPAEELPPSRTPVQDFVDLLLGRKHEAAATAESGYQVARLTEAAWQSSATGLPVRF